MKVIDKADNSLHLEDLSREIFIHQQLKHPNIVQFVQHIEDNENHYMLSEYCPDG